MATFDKQTTTTGPRRNSTDELQDFKEFDVVVKKIDVNWTDAKESA